MSYPQIIMVFLLALSFWSKVTVLLNGEPKPRPKWATFLDLTVSLPLYVYLLHWGGFWN